MAKYMHTPGPWYTHYRPIDERSFITDDAIKVCEVLALNNTLIIAAAPELLEALEFLLSSYRADFQTITGAPLNNTEAVKKATAAIHKATGGNP